MVTNKIIINPVSKMTKEDKVKLLKEASEKRKTHINHKKVS